MPGRALERLQRRQMFSHEAHKRVLRDYIKSLDDATERVDRLTNDIEELVAQSVLAPLVKALQSLMGEPIKSKGSGLFVFSFVWESNLGSASRTQS